MPANPSDEGTTPPRTAYQRHTDAVEEFMRSAKLEDRERFEAVCEAHPVITRHGWNQIRDRERSVGLLGLQACSIPPGIADSYGLETLVGRGSEDN